MGECLHLPEKNKPHGLKGFLNIFSIDSISYIQSYKAFSKIEKWFEVKDGAGS
jgi:hypothetical protein